MHRLLTDLPDLPREVVSLIRQVPRGRVTTYGRLSAALGSGSANRWIGELLLQPEPLQDCPIHRVVRADGEVGRYYTNNLPEKITLLHADGVEVVNGIVDLDRYVFEDFQSDRPLERLSRLQEELLTELSLDAPAEMPATAAGLDVSYLQAGEAVAAFTLLDVAGGNFVWGATLCEPVRFPYIPTFLAFREAPILLDLLDAVNKQRRLADVLFIDGNGILHDRHAGIATLIGIAADIPTIGVSKKLLCGQVDLKGMQPNEARPVIHQGETLGMALKSKRNSRPIFVSPGHRVDVPFALKLTRKLLRGHKLPEPTHLAHALSREEAQSRATSVHHGVH